VSGKSSVTTLLDEYAADLSRLIGSALTGLAEDVPQEHLLRKICMETARLVAYQRAYLLPAVTAIPGDGQELARLEDERLTVLLRTADELGTVPWGPVAEEPLRRLGGMAKELADHQREQTFPRLEKEAPEGELLALGEQVTPTMQPGTTHSHPVALKPFDGPGWPQPDFTAAAYDAFVEETRQRSPGIQLA
jgi:hypothetical protein